MEQIYQTEVDETDKLAISIRQFVAEGYNPLNKILPTMHKSLNYHSSYIDEFRNIVRNDLGLLLSRMDQELDQLDRTVIHVLSRISKSMTVMKVVYASLKKTGHLPQEWTRSYIMEVLHQGTQMSKTARVDDAKFPPTPQEEPVIPSSAEQPVNTQISTFKMDEDRSSEQDNAEEREEDDSGCVLIFSRTKRKMLKELIITVTKIKSLHNIKEIDQQSLQILEDYRLVFHELHLLLVSKIVDYTHNFVKLYKMHIEIMDIINPGMKFKLETIFDDKSVDQNNPIYGEIQRFVNSNFLTSAKIADLRQQIESSIRGAKTLKEIQKKVSQELVAITTTLGKDLEEMKMIIVYILQEMREGVLALKHIKENANVTGYRAFINFYDGKEDLKQLRKLIMVLNMLDINSMFDREVTEIVSSDQINLSRTVTNLLLSEINDDSIKFEQEVDRIVDITDMKKTITKYTTDFNKMIHNYTYKLRKSLKRMVTMFITIHEEFIILVNRGQIQNTELDNIPESEDMETEIGLILNYLAENAQIDIVNQYGGNFDIDSSSINQSKAVVKQQMHTLVQAMSRELSQLDIQIENVIDKIIQEVQNIEIIKRKLAANENFSIQAEQFPNLGLILHLSEFLQVLSAQNNIKKSHNQEVNKTFNNAREQIQTAKANAEQAIQESADVAQLKIHVTETTSNIRSILLGIGSDIKENLTEISSNFANTFEAFTSSNYELKDQILSANIQMEAMSEQLKDYLTNRYPNHVLNPFTQILSQPFHNQNLAQCKEAALTSLNEIMEKIERDMDVVRKESIVNVVEKLSRSIELMEHLQNSGKLVITEEETSLLAISNNMISILKDLFSTDSTYNADEMQNAMNLARETVTKEFSRAITSIQSMANEADIKTELSNSVQSIADTYTSLSKNIQNQLQSFATGFTENYESAMSNVLGKNDQLELIMQDIMNGQIASTRNIKLENTIAFISSNAFLATSEWIGSLFQSITQDTSGQFDSINQTAIHQLSILQGNVDNAIGNMYESVVSLVEDFKQSSTIIQSIINDQKVNLNEEQINCLSNSFELIQMLTKESATITSNSDFNNAKQSIIEAYQNTVKEIGSLKDDSIIHDVTIKTVESYTNIYEDLRLTTEELLAEKMSEFSASYNSIKETAQYTGNVDLKNMLAEIIQMKETLEPSQQLQEVETFMKSEQFTSSTMIQQLYENQPQATDIEKLNTLTVEVESYISKMEEASSFVQTKFAAATEFLTSIENSDTIQWSQEKITILAETISITEKLWPTGETEASSSSQSSGMDSAAEGDNAEMANANVRSLDQTTQEMTSTNSNVFSEAKNKILLEFDNAQNIIEEAKDEMSIQQTMNISVERLSTIFGDLQNKIKDNINNNWRTYTNSLLQTRNVEIENAQLQTTLQELLENKDYSAAFLDESFSRLSTIITGDVLQSANSVTKIYEQIHATSNIQLNINENSLEELRSIVKHISQNIDEMEFSETYIQKYLEQGSLILKEIGSGVVKQLNEEQIKILAVNAQIGELLQTTITSAEKPIAPVTLAETPYISETRNLINNELQTTVNTIKSMESEEGIVEATKATIQKTETIFNELKSNFQGQVAEKLTELKGNYESVIEITQKQGNNQLAEILKSTVNSENTGTSAILGEFHDLIESTVFTSTTVITDMFQACQNEVSPTESQKDWNLNALQIISTNINEHIAQIDNVATKIDDTLQQGLDILENIKNEQTVELTEEQISIISSSIKLEQFLTPKKPATIHTTEADFTETEVAIKQEFDKTIAALELLTDEGAITDIVTKTIENADSVFNILKEKVKVEITTTVSTFQEMITTFETSSHGHDNTIFEQVDQIFHGETVVQKDQSLVQIENYITSDAYISPSTVQALYNNIQQNDELNITNRSIQSIKELDNLVTDNIETMHEVGQNILTNFEQGTEIMKTLLNNEKIDFIKEQVQALSVCYELSNIISPHLENEVTDTVSMKTMSEECNKAKVEVNDIFENTKNTIKSLDDEKTIEQVALESVYSFENIYSDLKKSVQNQITITFTEFQQTMETALVTIQENGNENVANILMNLSEYQNNSDEAFSKYESFRSSNSYNSDTYVQNLFQEMQNNMSPSFNSIQEKTIEDLSQINIVLTEDVDNLQEMSNYTTQNIGQSLEILETIRNNSSASLTEEQIQTLALSKTIATPSSVTPAVTEEKIPSVLPTTEDSGNPLMPLAVEENNKSWSLLGWSSNDQPEINLTETKETIHYEYSKTVEILKTLGTEEEIQPVVADFVTNSNSVYNTVRENIHNEMAQNAQTLLQHYNTSMNIDYEERNQNLQKVMRDLNTEEYQFEATEDYRHFETFVTSTYFTSVEAIKETFIALQEDNIPEVVDNSVAERSIQQLGTLNQKTEEYIDEIGEMNTYVNNNFQKVSEILTQVETNEIVELTEEQIQTLTLGHEIINKLVPREETMDIPTEAQVSTEGSAQTITEIDITSTITTLNEELNTSVQAIELASNEDTVQQILTSSVQKYEEVFSNVRTEMQIRMTETTSTYESVYTETLNTVLESGNSNTANILQNIGTTQIEESEVLTSFESFINSNIYKSPNPVENAYNVLQQEDTIASLTNFNEKGVHELQLLNQQVVDNINKMQSTTSNVEQNLKSGLDILQSVQANTAVDLTDEQVKDLALCYKMSDILKTTNSDTTLPTTSHTETINQTAGIDTATAITTVQEDYQKAINAIRSATEVENIQTVLSDSIQNFDSVYSKAQETVKREMDIKITQFNEVRNSLLTENEEDNNNGVRSILTDNTDHLVNFETDENFKKFEEFVHSNQFQSSTLADNMYLQIKQNENQLSTNINERAEEELTLLSTQVTDNINMLEETKEYVNQHIGQAMQILQTAQQNAAYQPTEEGQVELSLSQTIISTILSVTVVETETQTNLLGEVGSLIAGDESPIEEVPVIVDAIQNKKEEAVNQIKELTDEESIKQVVADTVHNFDATVSEVQQSTDEKMKESTRQFEENYQSVIKLIEEGETDQYKHILNGELNFTPDDQYEAFEKYIKNNGFKLPSAETILNDVEENGELITHDINEKYAVELDIVSTQITQNMVELKDMTTYATKNLEKGTAILNSIAVDQNTELTEQQIQEVTLSQRIMQIITTAEEKAEVVKSNSVEKVLVAQQPIPEVDFANVELEMDKKVDECVEKIHSLTDEEEIVQVVAENVNESNTVYSALEQNVRQKIDVSSTSFIDQFQAAMSNAPEESPLKTIFDEIINHKTQFPTDLNEEFRQVQTQINDQSIMSSSAVDQIYNNIKESETLPVDIKQRSIMEIKTLNDEIKKNMVTMKHIDEFVSINLQDGLTVLQDIERQGVQELTEQQIQSLTISTTVSETLKTRTENEGTGWSTFLSSGTVVVPSSDEAEQTTMQNSTTAEENHSNALEVDEGMVHETKSISSVTEIQETLTSTNEHEEEALQCITNNNVTSVKGNIRNSGLISVNDLVVSTFFVKKKK